ncbi:MAG TPA: hydantoinase B/oxoprolinase family protein [Candidatus Dormibacteraeota bacterium]|nr:hydantoinase B/oxoprolinase family protein [Candidatus Dormibacteraeota bacterium]
MMVEPAIPGTRDSGAYADAVTTEVIRAALYSAAAQMKQALIRTAFSPIIYEVLDFAVAIYDRDVRLLAQAPSLPLFMGTMNFCVDAAVAAIGGVEELEPGDIILYNYPFGSGSHPQDCAVVMPVFLNETALVGYTTVKAHWLDIGAKEPYSTDTVDVFQEGTIFPGVKLYRRGELVSDIYRMALANSRVPKMVSGDINAEAVAVRTGGRELVRIIERYGEQKFWNAVDRMFDHGEAVMRSYLEQIPDGRYVGHGRMDNDGVSEEPIPFEVVLTVAGSEVQVDFSSAPDARRGPVNCPRPSTVSASRVALTMLAGGSEAPTEGHFRPIEVITRPGSMFEPVHPQPSFLYGWAALQSMEAIYQALSQVMPKAVPACSGGDICALVWWGTREATGEPWVDGSPHPVGQGGHFARDGGSSLLHHAESATRFAPIEVWEARNPWLVEKVELAPDSGGAGRHRGGLGVDMWFRMLEDAWVTSAVDRKDTAPWGLGGGGEGRVNSVTIRYPDGTTRVVGKATRLFLPKGTRLELATGGGGGYGEPPARPLGEVARDVAEGYVTAERARELYPQYGSSVGATAL